MNPLPKAPTRKTFSNQIQPWAAGAKSPQPRCGPGGGGADGASQAAGLPIVKPQVNRARPARNQSGFNRGLRVARIREAESVKSVKSVVNSPRQSAFNLLELLVVIAIIAVLASLLLPGLSRSKERARTVACMNNLKQLQLCGHFYALDFNDRLPPNNYVYDVDTLLPFPGFSTNYTWCPGDVRFDTNTDNIRHGLLFPYNRSAGIYRCPSDKSNPVTSDDVMLPVPKTRSYNLSNSINGHNTSPQGILRAPCFERESDINGPGPAALLTFIDVNEEEINDSTYGMTPPGWARVSGRRDRWWDLPADRHARGMQPRLRRRAYGALAVESAQGFYGKRSGHWRTRGQEGF